MLLYELIANEVAIIGSMMYFNFMIMIYLKFIM